MTRRTIATLAFAGLAAVMTLAPAPAAMAQAAADCDATHARLQQRLASKIESSFMKQRYASELAGAYRRCVAGDAGAWDRIGQVLS